MPAFVSSVAIFVISVAASVVVSASTSVAKSHERLSAGHGKATHHADKRNVAHSAGAGAREEASRESTQGQRVASGAKFDPSGYTCAHPSLPFGTHLRVADPKSGRSVVVTVNDRGPFVRGRALDLSLGAARALGMIGRGVMRVETQVI